MVNDGSKQWKQLSKNNEGCAAFPTGQHACRKTTCHQWKQNKTKTQSSFNQCNSGSALMEYLRKKQDEQGGYLVERDWQTSLMKRGEEESCYSSLLGNHATKSGKLENASFFVTVWRHVSPSFQPAAHGAGRSKSQRKVSTLLRNLITCGAVDTKDSMIELGLKYNSIKTSLHADVCLEICKVDKPGGSTRTSADPWNHGKHETASFDEVQDGRKSTNSGGFTDLKTAPAAYRPVRFPICSLCGKEFKPENLHSHMKSCKGMKSLTRNAVTASGTRDKASPWTSATTSDMISDHTSLLCH